MEKAVFGGGCFWCLDAAFRKVNGVLFVVSGYAGGQTENPDYDSVCSGTTGHAEVVEISYDPAIVTYDELLKIFFLVHDPTTLNRQGNDVGTQYRSIIFYLNEAQKQLAEKFITHYSESGQYKDTIKTELKPLEKFFSAEDYHQDYYSRNMNQPYCAYIIKPKIDKLTKSFLTDFGK